MALPQYNVQHRGPQDNRFAWDPTVPLEVELAKTGNTASYIEVTDIVHYEIGITPDLGWAITEQMFKPFGYANPDTTNAKLFTLNGLSVDNGNLFYDEESRQVYVELTDDHMDSFLSYGYPEYLWSVRGYDRVGNVSAWSEIRRFAAIYEAPSNWVTIEDVPSIATNKTITLHGYKDPYISVVEINGDTGTARYPSANSWAFDAALEPGQNSFQIRGHPIYGRATNYQKVTIDLFTGEVGRQLIPNTFDHFGSLYGVDRLVTIDESNLDYKRRIKDVFIHPSESNKIGLHHSIARQLDLTFDDYALIIRPTIIDSNRRADDVYPQLTLDISTNKFSLQSPGFVVTNEFHIVKPQDLSITLDYDMTPGFENSENVSVYISPGVQVEKEDYEVDFSNSKITFKLESYKYKNVWVKYARSLYVPIGSDISLSSLKTSIETIEFDGRQLLEVTLSSNRSGSESSDGLLRQTRTLSSRDRYSDENGDVQSGLPLRWTNFALHHLLDEDYWSRYLNEDGHVLNTKIESYVDSFKKKAHHTWEQVVLDKDIWDPVDEDTERSNHLWRMWDSIRGYWRSTNSNVTHRYSTTQAFDRGFIIELDKSIMHYFGIPKDEFKSGIGRDQDLKVVIKKPRVVEQLTEPNVFRATVNWSVTGQVEESSFLPPVQWGSLFFNP